MKLKLLKIIFICLLIILLAIFIYWAKDTTMNNEKCAEIYFLQLNEADCTIIKYKNQVIMIDTGEKDDEIAIIERLKELNIDSINYMILTHPDKDHIGNAKVVIENFKVEKIIQSGFDKGSELQKNLNNIVGKMQIENIIVDNEYNITVNDMTLNIYGTQQGQYKESNDNSLITIVDLGKRKVCLAGDIEKDRIQEILNKEIVPQCDVLKVPHHGRNNKLSEDFIKKVAPNYAIITSKNADEEIVTVLNNIRSKTYYTDKCEVKCITDGSRLYCTPNYK